MTADTRSRILEATGALYQRQGMTGTGLKQIAGAARAPFGSIYHYFPGGKAELTEEVVRTSGAAYGEFVMDIFDRSPDVPTAISAAFAVAAQVLVETDYAIACPIATIALEVASTDETLRLATADVFSRWIEEGARRFESTGLPADVRRRLIIALINSLEGAFVLSRALRSTEALEVAGESVLDATEAALARHSRT